MRFIYCVILTIIANSAYSLDTLYPTKLCKSDACNTTLSCIQQDPTSAAKAAPGHGAHSAVYASASNGGTYSCTRASGSVDAQVKCNSNNPCSNSAIPVFDDSLNQCKANCTAPKVADPVTLASCVCPSGQVDDGAGGCEPDTGPNCIAPEIEDPVFAECHLPCAVGEEWTPLNGGECAAPRCPAGEHPEAPLGWDGPVTFYVCAPDGDNYQEPDGPTCPNGEETAGYIDGNAVCSGELEACEAAGGAIGDVNGSTVCIPAFETIPTELPDCGPGEVMSFSDANPNGVCRSLDDTTDIPDSPGLPDLDTDGDGIPNHSDNDIDGDGILNGVDSDRDGDGVSNSDDRDPWGDGEGSDSSASGGIGCDTAPTCDGDAVQCAILNQQWLDRCGTNLTGDNQCVTVPTCSGSPWQCSVRLAEWRQRCALGPATAAAQGELDALVDANTLESLNEGEEDLSALVTDAFTEAGSTASCPGDHTLTIAGNPYSFSFQPACDMAAQIRPVVMVFFGMYSFRTIMSAL